MGRRQLSLPAGAPPFELPESTRLRRRKPRSYVEWKTLRGWGKLPPWEVEPPGYRLRELREGAGLTQRELAERLGCSQQAVAQAERFEANPTARFLSQWAEALGMRLELRFEPGC